MYIYVCMYIYRGGGKEHRFHSGWPCRARSILRRCGFSFETLPAKDQRYLRARIGLCSAADLHLIRKVTFQKSKNSISMEVISNN